MAFQNGPLTMYALDGDGERRLLVDGTLTGMRGDCSPHHLLIASSEGNALACALAEDATQDANIDLLGWLAQSGEGYCITASPWTVDRPFFHFWDLSTPAPRATSVGGTFLDASRSGDCITYRTEDPEILHVWLTTEQRDLLTIPEASEHFWRASVAPDRQTFVGVHAQPPTTWTFKAVSLRDATLGARASLLPQMTVEELDDCKQAFSHDGHFFFLVRNARFAPSMQRWDLRTWPPVMSPQRWYFDGGDIARGFELTADNRFVIVHGNERARFFSAGKLLSGD